MKEDFLHYLWEAGKIPLGAMITTQGLPVMVKGRGQYNTDAGPDFLKATLYIGDTQWCGHVEMHLNSSDWYDHHHHLDERYDNVILHVVWHHDREVYYRDGTSIPVVSLEGSIPRYFLNNYQRLTGISNRLLNCSGQTDGLSKDLWQSWLAILFEKRMERRTAAMLSMDMQIRTHWEELLFRAVFRYMGARVNADAFYSLAEVTGVENIRKMVAAGEQVEVVLHGLSGLLGSGEDNKEVHRRKREYDYLCKKYRLIPQRVVKPVFFRLRPAGFPTIRLSQLSKLYQSKRGLFADLLLCEHPDAMRKVLSVSAFEYWDTRYTYSSGTHPPRKKVLSRERIDLLLINAVFPVLYTYYKHRRSPEMQRILTWASGMPAEQNKIVDLIRKEGFPVTNAANAQGVLELYHNFCSRNKCLQCQVGRFIIDG